jgi:hypothetical protein
MYLSGAEATQFHDLDDCLFENRQEAEVAALIHAKKHAKLVLRKDASSVVISVAARFYDGPVKWFWMDGTPDVSNEHHTPVEYGPELSARLSVAFTNGIKAVAVDEERQITLDRDDFFQRRFDDPYRKRRVIRVEDGDDDDDDDGGGLTTFTGEEDEEEEAPPPPKKARTAPRVRVLYLEYQLGEFEE